jgi:nicotinate-nucleotide pyrophosphorylase (carboxylating)
MVNFSDASWHSYFEQWLSEDIGSGDHSSLASIAPTGEAFSRLLLKEDGVVAGLELAVALFQYLDPKVQFTLKAKDGIWYPKGTLLAEATGSAHSLLKGERLMLNLLQRLSGIATQTHQVVRLVSDTGLTLLDTRKTTPGLRILEKWAVTQGGGQNHRMGLYDMIMLKDNHVDSAGGIDAAITRTRDYLKAQGLDLKIEVETRNLEEVRQALAHRVDRIMFDNFSPDMCREAVLLVNGLVETEASGGIHLGNIKEYAETGVNYISVGSLTHSVKALDMSFKTQLKA